MSRALLLNASYEPLMTLPVRRVVNLVLEDKAEVLEEQEWTFGSASFQMFEPAVARLNYMVHPPYRARIPLNRRAVVVRDRGVCAYAGQHRPKDAPQCTGHALTMDHVKPRARGGQHRWENVVAACGRCNAYKDDHTLAELGWELKFTPFAPAGTHWLVLGLGTVDPLWSAYLDPQGAQATA